MFSIQIKMDSFKLLEDSTNNCKLCPRLQNKKKILSQRNGNIDSDIMFIAEAPGRLGADRTGIPLHGDQTGKNFQYFLDLIGLDRDDIFITNAILCNPCNKNGNNAIPKIREIRNCSIYLNILLNIIKPKIVITLGGMALKSLNYIKSHKIKLKENVGRKIKWNSIFLIPLYHPGPRARVYRNLSQQISDFLCLKELLKKDFPIFKKTGLLAKQEDLFNSYINPTILQKLITYITQRLGTLTKFKLAKLIYLIDYEFYKNRNSLFTESFYIYQNAGPLQTVLTKRLKDLEGFELRKIYKDNDIFYMPFNRVRFNYNFEESEEKIIDRVINKFSSYSDERIKTFVYLTEPMRYFLKERKKGINILNKPVFKKHN